MGIFRRFLRQKKLVIIIEILILAGAGFYFFSSRNSTTPETASVARGEVKEELVLSGEIKANKDAILGFQSSGTITWVGVVEGQQVQKGEALIKLDTFKLNSIYQRALASYRLTQTTVDRVHDDLKDKGNSESFTEKETRTAAEVANDQAYEAMITAKKDLRDATIISPFEGVVTSLTNPNPGVNVTAGVAQIEVVDPQTIYFLSNADQTDVTKIKKGQKGTVSLDAFEGREFEAELVDISLTQSQVESGTVYPLRLKILGLPEDLGYRIGMSGDVSFATQKKEKVLYVPTKFVKSDKEGKFVFVGDGKTKKYIEVGVEGDDRTEISGDIKEGEVVFD